MYRKIIYNPNLEPCHIPLIKCGTIQSLESLYRDDGESIKSTILTVLSNLSKSSKHLIVYSKIISILADIYSFVNRRIRRKEQRKPGK